MPAMESAFYIPAFGALVTALAWCAREWQASRAECRMEVEKREALAERVIVALERANVVAASLNDFLRRYEAGDVAIR